jgi:hypothetical protein
LGDRPAAMVVGTGERRRGTVRHRVEEEAGIEGDPIWGGGGGEGSLKWALHSGVARPTAGDGGMPERRRTPVR